MSQIQSPSTKSNRQAQTPFEEEDTFMKTMREAHDKVNSKFEELNDLKSRFIVSQQQKFVEMFVNIMQKLSNELKQATDAYNEIDRQISAEQRCADLKRKQESFQSQCLHLKKELIIKKEELKRQNIKNRKLLMERYQLQRQLYSSTSKQMKYRQKTRSLLAKNISQSQRRSFKSGDGLQSKYRSVESSSKTDKIKTGYNFGNHKKSYSVATYLLKSSAALKTETRNSKNKARSVTRTLRQKRSELFCRSGDIGVF